MDIWRRSPRISRRNKTRNTVIKINEDDIVVKQLKYYGLVQRMGDNGLSNQVMAWYPTRNEEENSQTKNYMHERNSQNDERNGIYGGRSLQDF